MKKALYIIGAGSVGGHVALNIGEYSDEFEVKGFFDDDPEKKGTEQFGFKVLGKVDGVLKLDNVAVIIGIAFPQIKQKIFQKIAANSSLNYPSFIHPKAWISKNVSVGKGCIIYPGTVVNYGSQIKDFCVLNMNCSVGHHTVVGRFSSLAPGVNIGGHTTVAEGVDIGIGASTLQQIEIGEYSIIGGQSMVIGDVSPGSKVAGVPAKVISKSRTGANNGKL